MKEILSFRYRRMRTMALILILSQGVPMITAGDEFGRSQGGNNNCWCQDNKTSWLDWNLAHSNKGLVRFFKKCLELRKNHLIFRRRDFFSNGLEQEITWQSLVPGTEDWSSDCHTLAFFLHGRGENDDFFIMLNGHRTVATNFIIPSVSDKKKGWKQIVDTARETPFDFPPINKAVTRESGDLVQVKAMAAVVLQSS